MRPRVPLLLAVGLLGVLLAAATLRAQRGGMFRGSIDDPAIAYTKAPLANAVVDLNQKLADGTRQLTSNGRSGYLQAALDALQIPVDSQMLVFSPTSFQARRISQANPRALFFNDRVALGWVRDGDVIEVAAHDATEGIVFYTLDQRPAPDRPVDEPPRFRRAFSCLGCHVAGDTLGVPGLLMFSTMKGADANGFLRAVAMDQRTPLADRWGGWFVTGGIGGAVHHGNEAAALEGQPRRELASVEGLFDPDGYRSSASDVAALLVLSHQTHMMNLLTRVGWEARAADPALHPPSVSSPDEEKRIAQMMSGIAAEVVDYLLFIDEAPLPAGIRGASGFAERFSAAGPRDAAGRSLHQLDLTRRLLKYPCSYLVYSAAFDALPPAAKAPVYRRMWEVLSGAERAPRYRSALSSADRTAIVEILRDTKPDLPAYFRGAISP
jgi:hypothetical protein